ncbi:hypothetical protein RchiOBHm_Chr4g0396491 [Rosa chinensis]|uniref:Uncharacterized protein n=1 Tax=Rosa chinensis TaxID=74649 RepID=A0A2P6QRS6_ROSCH|nr:hypothetical protein RchiOBHm_Chr4g0396491 [Rosa chinensis]
MRMFGLIAQSTATLRFTLPRTGAGCRRLQVLESLRLFKKHHIEIRFRKYQIWRIEPAAAAEERKAGFQHSAVGFRIQR